MSIVILLLNKMNVHKLKNLIELVTLKSLTSGDHHLLYKLAKSWTGIVGKNFAHRTQVFTIQDCGNNQKRIIIKVMNSAEIFEINNYRLLLQERINTFLGEELIIETFLTT